MIDQLKVLFTKYVISQNKKLLTPSNTSVLLTIYLMTRIKQL